MVKNLCLFGVVRAQNSLVRHGAYHWADAMVDGQTVVVSSAKTPKPVNVRYGYANYLPWANLFNKAGLPALTFRTDG